MELFQAPDGEWMGLGKFHCSSPEAPYARRLTQEVSYVHLPIDITSCRQQHQTLFALRFQEGAMAITGVLTRAREKTRDQGNQIDEGKRELIPQAGVMESDMPKFVAEYERKARAVIVVQIGEQFAMQDDEINAEGGGGKGI